MQPAGRPNRSPIGIGTQRKRAPESSKRYKNGRPLRSILRLTRETSERVVIKMGVVKTKDGVEIFYKDWGKGQPVVFSHGWPLSADDWDTQMLFFVKNGYRVVAHDRRGHGRSTQVGEGHDMDHYADDLAAVTPARAIHTACPRHTQTSSRPTSWPSSNHKQGEKAY
jgi:serine aminopeptidase S33 family